MLEEREAWKLVLALMQRLDRRKTVPSLPLSAAPRENRSDGEGIPLIVRMDGATTRPSRTRGIEVAIPESRAESLRGFLAELERNREVILEISLRLLSVPVEEGASRQAEVEVRAVRHEEAERRLRELEDGRADLLTSPRLTIFNGQSASLSTATPGR